MLRCTRSTLWSKARQFNILKMFKRRTVRAIRIRILGRFITFEIGIYRQYSYLSSAWEQSVDMIAVPPFISTWTVNVCAFLCSWQIKRGWLTFKTNLLTLVGINLCHIMIRSFTFEVSQRMVLWRGHELLDLVQFYPTFALSLLNLFYTQYEKSQICERFTPVSSSFFSTRGCSHGTGEPYYMEDHSTS